MEKIVIILLPPSLTSSPYAPFGNTLYAYIWVNILSHPVLRWWHKRSDLGTSGGAITYHHLSDAWDRAIKLIPGHLSHDHSSGSVAWRSVVGITRNFASSSIWFIYKLHSIGLFYSNLHCFTTTTLGWGHKKELYLPQKCCIIMYHYRIYWIMLYCFEPWSNLGRKLHKESRRPCDWAVCCLGQYSLHALA